MGKFSREISELIIEKISIKKYFHIEKLKDVQDVLKALNFVLLQKKEVLKKEFSAEVFEDLKRYEEIEPKVLRILKDFGKDDYVRDYNICSNYSQVHIKGNITLKTKENFINIREFSGGIAFSSKDLYLIEEIKVLGQKVIIIESLTAFNNYEEADGAFIYLGGLQNFVRQEMLIKILNSNKCQYYYYGNIDVESLKIYNYLKRKTNIPFQSLNMSKEMLISNRECCKELSANDKKALTEILEDEKYIQFNDVVRFMLKENIKLEYERV